MLQVKMPKLLPVIVVHGEKRHSAQIQMHGKDQPKDKVNRIKYSGKNR